MTSFSYTDHIPNSSSLVTPYEETRAGFIALALEKNRKATPLVEEAKSLRAIAIQASIPEDLLKLEEIRPSILTAAGLSGKAEKYLTEQDKTKAIEGLIDKFLKPAGKEFAEELVYRFLLTRGDSLGGRLRNLAGKMAERKLSRSIMSALALEGRSYSWLHSKSGKWIKKGTDDSDIELHLRGLHWRIKSKARTLIYNLRVPIVGNNVDLCLFDCMPVP